MWQISTLWTEEVSLLERCQGKEPQWWRRKRYWRHGPHSFPIKPETGQHLSHKLRNASFACLSEFCSCHLQLRWSQHWWLDGEASGLFCVLPVVICQMWFLDSSWLSSCFLIKKEQNQKGYLLITRRIYLLLRQRLEKDQFIANVSCRFADFRQLTGAAIIHTKNIHCVANNSFWWMRPW